ncbi:MAG: hypothetical protein ACJ784_04680, partial [Myxococcales bacterium]
MRALAGAETPGHELDVHGPALPQERPQGAGVLLGKDLGRSHERRLVSVLDELPPGRTPIATRVYRDAARDRAYEVIRKELRAGRQAYVVLPLVEESEKLLDVKAATKERDR